MARTTNPAPGMILGVGGALLLRRRRKARRRKAATVAYVPGASPRRSVLPDGVGQWLATAAVSAAADQWRRQGGYGKPRSRRSRSDDGWR